MTLRKAVLLGASIAAAGLAFASTAQAQNEQFIPGLIYRTGAYAPNGIPFANGVADYYALVNERDGGINGVKILYEECDTGYATDRGVECYERLKNKGPTGAAYVNPLSTGITFALTEKAPVDKIPVISMGYGRSESRATAACSSGTSRCSAPTGRPPTSSCSTSPSRRAASTSSRARRSCWSITTRPTARSRSRCSSSAPRCTASTFTPMPVTHPGVEQKATWLQIRQNRPDYVLLWGWGVMNSTSIKEAAAVGFPRDKMFGVWWSGAEPDVRPAEGGAKGYHAAMLQHGAGQFGVHADLKKFLYDKGKGVGEVGRGRRGPLQPRPGQRHAGRRVDPQGADQVRQEAADRRAGPLGHRESRSQRRAAQGAGLRGHAAAAQGDVPATTKARAPAASSSGTAPSGSWSPTGISPTTRC